MHSRRWSIARYLKAAAHTGKNQIWKYLNKTELPEWF